MVKSILDYNSVDWSSSFYYDEESKSYLKWKTDVYSGKHMSICSAEKGSDAGSISIARSRGESKYYNICFRGKKYRAHRIIWILFNGDMPENAVIDHVNGNSLDNSIDNLRVVNMAVNSRNAKMRKSNSSNMNGVCWRLHKNGTYAVSQWYEDIDTSKTKQRSKYFSVKNLGLLPAFALACKYRKDKIKELNSLGYGYSENHGK